MRSEGINSWPDILPARILLPLDGLPVSATLGFTITLAPIVFGIGLLHTSTDYEIRTAPRGGGSVVWSSPGDLALQVKIVPIGALSGLLAGQTYYVRARFRAGADVGSWSEDTVVTT